MPMSLLFLFVACIPRVAVIGLDTSIPRLHDTTATALPRVSLLDRSGRPVEAAVDWEVSDPTIARIEGGLVVALRNGDAELIARSGAASGRWPLKVRMPTAVDLRVPDSGLEVGESGWFTAVATVGADPEPDVPVTWRSLQPQVLEVDVEGRARAVSVGEATVVARAGGAEGTAVVVVRAVTVGEAPPVAAPVEVAVASPGRGTSWTDAASNRLLRYWGMAQAPTLAPIRPSPRPKRDVPGMVGGHIVVVPIDLAADPSLDAKARMAHVRPAIITVSVGPDASPDEAVVYSGPGFLTESGADTDSIPLKPATVDALSLKVFLTKAGSTVTRAEMVEVLRSAHAAMRRCHPAAWKGGAGVVELRWTVDPAGRVTDVGVATQRRVDEELVRCEIQVARSIQFGPRESADEVGVGLVFD